MAEDAGEDEESPILEIEATGPDGRVSIVRGRHLDGPIPCPFCDQGFSVFETEGGEGFVCHPNPICQPFTDMALEDYMRAVQEADAGVNSLGRGAA